RNYKKQLVLLQKLMASVKNQRKDMLHKLSNQITNDYDAIVVEDIDLRNLAQCLKLGKRLHDNGVGMFRTMLQYKCKKKGKHYIVAPTFFASSKICSCCGHKKETLLLSERTYHCTECGAKTDRDYNAACNLKQYGFAALPQHSLVV
ncbi:MAG: RNA-guided endonuclease InsQ/TnpB family protein, partial [Ectobacillus sp.]